MPINPRTPLTYHLDFFGARFLTAEVFRTTRRWLMNGKLPRRLSYIWTVVEIWRLVNNLHTSSGPKIVFERLEFTWPPPNRYVAQLEILRRSQSQGRVLEEFELAVLSWLDVLSVYWGRP